MSTAGTPAGAAAARIVVIEDDDAIRALVARILSDGGYEVVECADSTEAVERVRAVRPDLVISDIAMPNVDGYGVLKALQSDSETARYPVVFLTAHREFTERLRAFRFGVVDYVTKPFTREILLRKVQRVLAERASGPGRLRTEGAGAADRMLRDLREQARSGVLRLTAEGGETRVVMRAGEVVETTGALPTAGSSAAAEFEELDARREDILAHDPPSLPAGRAELTPFEDVPEPLRKVLVVDDNPLFRRFLRDVLQGRGFTVFEAEEGEEALRIALERRPWLILTDVMMPGVDGVELCRRVRQHSLIRHTPLIFLSGWDDYKDRYRGLEAGGDEFLSKSTPVRELLIRVQLLLRRYSEVGRERKGHGMTGEVEVIGTSGLLQMCHLGRLSGTCAVRSDAGLFEARFKEGEIVAAACGELSGEEAVFAFLGWTEGRFTFVAGDPGGGSPLAEHFDQLLLEGCRRLDERNAARSSE